jgi:type II secretory pathway component GspD/PulD (secretin)
VKRKPWTVGRIFLPLLILVMTWPAQDLYGAEEEQGESRVVIKDGMMSLSTTDCPLSDVLENIEKQSKVSFVLDRSLQEERVSLAFRSTPFLEGLKRILSRMSYLLFFDSSSNLVQVIVIKQRKGYLPVARSPSMRPPRTYGPRSQGLQAASPSRIRRVPTPWTGTSQNRP